MAPDFWPDLEGFLLVVTPALLVLGWYYARAVWNERHNDKENSVTAELRNWYEIDPKDAVDINLADDLTITAPLNEEGERCPWPWEPQQLVGAPLGQYRCPYCMAMVMAGMRHVDYAESEN